MRIGIDAHILVKKHKRYDARIARYTEQLITHMIESDEDKKHTWVLFFDSRSNNRLKKFEQENVEIKHFPFIHYRQYLPVVYSHMLISAFLRSAKLDVFHSPEVLNRGSEHLDRPHFLYLDCCIQPFYRLGFLGLHVRHFPHRSGETSLWIHRSRRHSGRHCGLYNYRFPCNSSRSGSASDIFRNTAGSRCSERQAAGKDLDRNYQYTSC